MLLLQSCSNDMLPQKTVVIHDSIITKPPVHIDTTLTTHTVDTIYLRQNNFHETIYRNGNVLTIKADKPADTTHKTTIETTIVAAPVKVSFWEHLEKILTYILVLGGMGLTAVIILTIKHFFPHA